MGTIIVTILIVYVGWFLLRPLISRYLRRKMTERMEDMFARQFGMPDAKEARRQYEEARREAERQARRNRKIFSKEEGEYIEFEEITVTQTTTATSAPAEFPTEPQVSDAEWEEI